VLASAPTDAKTGASAAPADPVVGGHPHSAHVQVRFDFLDFLLVNTAGELRLDQKAVDTLWDVYVTNPLHPTDRARCLAWYVVVALHLSLLSRPFPAFLCCLRLLATHFFVLSCIVLWRWWLGWPVRL
jgi:hypothetical protein